MESFSHLPYMLTPALPVAFLQFSSYFLAFLWSLEALFQEKMSVESHAPQVREISPFFWSITVNFGHRYP